MPNDPTLTEQASRAALVGLGRAASRRRSPDRSHGGSSRQASSLDRFARVAVREWLISPAGAITDRGVDVLCALLSKRPVTVSGHLPIVVHHRSWGAVAMTAAMVLTCLVVLTAAATVSAVSFSPVVATACYAVGLVSVREVRSRWSLTRRSNAEALLDDLVRTGRIEASRLGPCHGFEPRYPTVPFEAIRERGSRAMAVGPQKR